MFPIGERGDAGFGISVPSGAEIIGEVSAGLEGRDTEEVSTCSASASWEFFLGEGAILGRSQVFREDCSDEDAPHLGVLLLAVLLLVGIRVTEVFITYVAGLGVEDIGRWILVMHDDTCCYGCGGCKSGVGNDGPVEMRTGIEGDGAGFYDVNSINLLRGEGEAESEAERSALKDVATGITLGIDNVLTSVFDQGRGTCTECRADLVAIHALTVIDMVADGVVDVVSKVSVAFTAELVDNLPERGVEFGFIETFDDESCSALVEDVVAVEAIATTLYGRSVSAVADTVVFPSEVVKTVGIDASKHLCFIFCRCALLDVIHRFAAGTNACLEDELAVVGQLARHFTSVGISDDESGCGAELLFQTLQRNFNHFHCSFQRYRIADFYGNGAFGRLGAHECNCHNCRQQNIF